MRVIFKALIVVVIILAFPLSIVLVFKNWSTAIGTSTPMQLKFDWLDQYEPIYLFWSGIILAAVLIVLLIITLFWPRSQSLYLHQKSDGQVTISKKAIEHFALSALQHEPFIGNPKVSAKLSRKRITLKISGDLLNSVNAKKQTANFLNQLKKDLRICLGISEQKKIKIRLVDFNESDANVHQSRVI
ncbi:alkaline shock response membrane anchor protein AmaP [Limosilactobacillus fermentum]|uniref:alkaline shock response membrane anchor protein AmaP n=1 Tax=Limosilactobacillus fermentum TaxID=1613 RepID=UPI000DAAFAAE|nr:alkaline shock response membrane anchor protein AmaP [Limosilactobacillus fermentum]AWV30073.1 alkaline shock response membrane anchor protein AmaP [Limosilactobacillus fermentum]